MCDVEWADNSIIGEGSYWDPTTTFWDLMNNPTYGATEGFLVLDVDVRGSL